jgi:PAP2 superfamily
MRVAVACLMLLGGGSMALADVGDPDPGVRRSSLAMDGAITIAGTLSFFAPSFFENAPALPRSSCGWCAGNKVDDEMREHLRWDNVQLARDLSNVGLYTLPVAAIGLTAIRSESSRVLLEDSVLILEAAMMTMNINQISKLAVGRMRPMVRFGMEAPDDDSNLSFFSGHTSLVTSMTMSAATISFLRKRPEAPWVLGLGLGLSGLTGYMRIAGDKHYFSDVMVGAGMGMAVGFAVPYLYHHMPNVRISAAPIQDGALVGIGGTF